MNDGGQAFPTKGKTFHANKAEYCNNVYTIKMAGGMSLRDWYKGIVVSGILAQRVRPAETLDADDMAAAAGKIADAMLKERGK